MERAKHLSTIATSAPVQAAIVQFLKHSATSIIRASYGRELQARQNRMLQAVRQNFPQGTRLTRPSGPYSLWIEMPERPITGTGLLLAGWP